MRLSTVPSPLLNQALGEFTAKVDALKGKIRGGINNETGILAVEVNFEGMDIDKSPCLPPSDSNSLFSQRGIEVQKIMIALIHAVDNAFPVSECERAVIITRMAPKLGESQSLVWTPRDSSSTLQFAHQGRILRQYLLDHYALQAIGYFDVNLLDKNGRRLMATMAGHAMNEEWDALREYNFLDMPLTYQTRDGEERSGRSFNYSLAPHAQYLGDERAVERSIDLHPVFNPMEAKIEGRKRLHFLLVTGQREIGLIQAGSTCLTTGDQLCAFYQVQREQFVTRDLATHARKLVRRDNQTGNGEGIYADLDITTDLTGMDAKVGFANTEFCELRPIALRAYLAIEHGSASVRIRGSVNNDHPVHFPTVTELAEMGSILAASDLEFQAALTRFQERIAGDNPPRKSENATLTLPHGLKVVVALHGEQAVDGSVQAAWSFDLNRAAQAHSRTLAAVREKLAAAVTTPASVAQVRFAEATARYTDSLTPFLEEALTQFEAVTVRIIEERCLAARENKLTEQKTADKSKLDVDLNTAKDEHAQRRDSFVQGTQEQYCRDEELARSKAEEQYETHLQKRYQEYLVGLNDWENQRAEYRTRLNTAIDNVAEFEQASAHLRGLLQGEDPRSTFHQAAEDLNARFITGAGFNIPALLSAESNDMFQTAFVAGFLEVVLIHQDFAGPITAHTARLSEILSRAKREERLKYPPLLKSLSDRLQKISTDEERKALVKTFNEHAKAILDDPENEQERESHIDQIFELLNVRGKERAALYKYFGDPSLIERKEAVLESHYEPIQQARTIKSLRILMRHLSLELLRPNANEIFAHYVPQGDIETPMDLDEFRLSIGHERERWIAREIIEKIGLPRSPTDIRDSFSEAEPTIDSVKRVQKYIEPVLDDIQLQQIEIDEIAAAVRLERKSDEPNEESVAREHGLKKPVFSDILAAISAEMGIASERVIVSSGKGGKNVKSKKKKK